MSRLQNSFLCHILFIFFNVCLLDSPSKCLKWQIYFSSNFYKFFEMKIKISQLVNNIPWEGEKVQPLLPALLHRGLRAEHFLWCLLKKIFSVHFGWMWKPKKMFTGWTTMNSCQRLKRTQKSSQIIWNQEVRKRRKETNLGDIWLNKESFHNFNEVQ